MRPGRVPREPVINAPGVVVALTALLIGAHLARLVAPEGAQAVMFVDGALIPERFWAGTGSDLAYGSPLAAATTLFSHALLHSGWGHLGVNAVMLLAVGAPVARYFGPGGGAARFLLVLGAGVFAGGLTHLLLHAPAGPPVVGASGGVSGLIAAALMAVQGVRLVSRRFGVLALAFVGANLLFAFAAPYALGGGIAWEAHIGGFLGGAAAFEALRRR